MTMTTTADALHAQLLERRESPAEVVRQLLAHYRAAGMPVELFEAMKMSTRLALGLPAVASADEDTLSPAIERQLEDGLLQGCREAGAMMIRQGRVLEGWMYLRPVGDRAMVRKLLADIPIDEENYDAMIQVLVHEAIDVGRGYAAVIDQQGTCNSITLYEQTISQFSLSDRQAAASVLLNHFYDELFSLVKQDVASRDAPAQKTPIADDESLGQVVQTRPWILSEGGYHLDTTHLASTVRIAGVLTDPADLQKASDLTAYGHRLHHQFQYPGEEPFVDFYPAYAAFYRVLLGQDVSDGLQLFRRKAHNVDPLVAGTGAIETYTELLARSGQPMQAIREMIELMPADVPTQHYFGSLLQHLGEVPEADRPAARKLLQDFCLDRGDLLGFAAVCGKV